MNLVNILKTLINIETHSNTNNKKCVDFICALLEENNIIYKRIPNPNNDKDNIIAGINITKLKNINNGIILSGHIDTVSANPKEWRYFPYTATEIDGNIYGRGAIDMKYFIAVLLSSLQEFKKIKFPIIFALTCDEETDVLGIIEVIKFLKQHNIKTPYAIIGEPTNFFLCTKNKGYLGYSINITGISAHSSSPNLGCNAIYIASKITLKLEQLNKKYTSKNTTINVGKINGGLERNTVPNNAIIDWDIRYSSNKHKNEIITELNLFISKLMSEYKKANIELLKKEYLPCFEKNNNSLLSKKTKQILKLEEKSLPYSTEAGFWTDYGIDTIVFGAGDETTAHTSKEFIKIKDLHKYKNALLNILQNIFTI